LLICSTRFTSRNIIKYIIINYSSLPFNSNRTIDHAICTFNLPTEYKALGQEHIIDEADKVKIKVDPSKMNVDDIMTTQLEEIVDGWMKFITKAFRDASEKVSILSQQ
jgi:hypothetical protein